MVSEVRFRDVLSHKSNLKILESIIREIIGKNDIKWTLLSKELPLPFDVVGLQFKYCDIVGLDQDQNIYIIELKREINNKNLTKTEKQVTEYVKLFTETISYIKNGKPLFYPHLILKRYFEYVNFNYNNIKSVIPIIISIDDTDESIVKKSSLKCRILDINTRRNLLKNYITNKYTNFINIYQELFSEGKEEIKIKNIIDEAIQIGRIDKRSWFPVVLNRSRFNDQENFNQVPKSQIPYKYTIIFENINNFNKKRVDVSRFCASFVDLTIPELYLYISFKPTEIFKEIYKQSNTPDMPNLPKFTIQLFRSGRTNPIIYLQITEDVYVPLMQIKPVVFSVGPFVNDVIVYDMKEQSIEDKKCFYEEVISFDQGHYEISSNKSEGVLIYTLKLFGKRNNYLFHAYSPKFRSVKELMPYMNPEKVKNHLKTLLEGEYEDYLFKTKKEDTIEWITSRIHITK